MKGLICYFSTTGNTKLACEFITGRLQNVSFSLLDITREPLPDLDSYQVVGFASFADLLAPSVLITNVIKTLQLSYNHCPNQAVYTKMMKNIGHYPRPNEQLRAKLVK